MTFWGRFRSHPTKTLGSGGSKNAEARSYTGKVLGSFIYGKQLPVRRTKTEPRASHELRDGRVGLQMRGWKIIGVQSAKQMPRLRQGTLRCGNLGKLHCGGSPALKLCLCASLDSFVAMQTWCSNTAAVNAAWSNTIAGYLAWCLGCPPDPEINESRKCLRNYLQAWPFQSRRPLLQHDAQDSRGTFFDSLGMLLVRPSRMFIDPVANPRRRQLCIPDF